MWSYYWLWVKLLKYTETASNENNFKLNFLAMSIECSAQQVGVWFWVFECVQAQHKLPSVCCELKYVPPLHFYFLFAVKNKVGEEGNPFGGWGSRFNWSQVILTSKIPNQVFTRYTRYVPSEAEMASQWREYGTALVRCDSSTAASKSRYE